MNVERYNQPDPTEIHNTKYGEFSAQNYTWNAQKNYYTEALAYIQLKFQLYSWWFFFSSNNALRLFNHGILAIWFRFNLNFAKKSHFLRQDIEMLKLNYPKKRLIAHSTTTKLHKQ